MPTPVWASLPAELGFRFSMTISRDRDGTTVKIVDTAKAKEIDSKFINQDVGLDGGRTMLVRDNGMTAKRRW